MQYSFSSMFRYLIRINFGFFFIKDFFNSTIDKKDFNNPLKIIAHIKKSIAQASLEKSKLLYLGGYDILYLDGMSSRKVRHLYNNLCSINNINHLEVGTWKGSTLVSSKFRNNIHSTAIDNWSQFDGPKNECMNNLERYKLLNTIKFIDQDCFTVDLNREFNNKIQIYLFDGDHSYLSQYNAFTYFNEILDDLFIAIVDDYNIEEVQKGTQDAFKKLKYNILFQTYLPSFKNGDQDSWWNGTYIALIDKSGRYIP